MDMHGVPPKHTHTHTRYMLLLFFRKYSEILLAPRKNQFVHKNANILIKFSSNSSKVATVDSRAVQGACQGAGVARAEQVLCVGDCTFCAESFRCHSLSLSLSHYVCDSL